MSFIKKSIIYDQKRKLSFVSIILLLVLSFSTIEGYENLISKYKLLGDLSSSYMGYSSFRILVLLIILLGTIISIGFKERSERLCIAAMPMNKQEILLTKFLCVNIAIIVPFIVNFILESLLYISNKEAFITSGYYYQNVLIINIVYIISAMFIIGFIFLINLFFNNIKISTTIFIGSFISFKFIIDNNFNNFIDYSIVWRIDRFINQIINPNRQDLNMYTYKILGMTIVLIGSIILLYNLIIHITSILKGDSYSNLYSLKFGKCILNVASFVMILTILIYIIGAFIDMVYLNRIMMAASSEADHLRLSVLSFRIFIGVEIIALIGSYFINKKVVKKLESIYK